MNVLLISTLALFCCFAPSSVLARPSISHESEQLVLEGSKIKIRPANKHDLDDITTVIIDAFSPGPLYHYIFPNFERYREYYWRCGRKEAGQTFAKKTKTDFWNVISVPVSDRDSHLYGGRHERVVSIAAWDIIEPIDGVHVRSASVADVINGKKCSDHLGMNVTRALDYSQQFGEADKRYVDGYPQKQLYLATLATHPDWDGHGFGAAQVHWGLTLAAELNVSATLLATPAGWPLYDSLGFDSLANITITTLDASPNLWFEYMRYDIQ